MSSPAKKILLATTLFALAATSACTKQPSSTGTAFEIQWKSDEGTPIAQIADLKISKEGFLARTGKIRNFPNLLTRAMNETDSREQMLDGEIRRELLAREAIERGYQNDPEVQLEFKKNLVRKMMIMEGRKIADDAATDEEIQAYYDSHPEAFSEPEKMKANLIFIPFADNKSAALLKAKAIHKEVSVAPKNQNRIFKEAAVKYAELYGQKDGSRPAVDTGIRTSEQFATRFGEKAQQAVWKSEQREITPVVEGPDGFYIFRKVYVKKATHQELAQVKPMISRKIVKQKRGKAMAALVDSLKSQYGVKIFEDQVATIDYKKELASGTEQEALSAN